MAIAASSFTVDKKLPLGAGAYMIIGTYTLPASYTSGGETLTQAILHQATGCDTLIWGRMGWATDSGGTTYTNVILDQLTQTGTDQAKIHIGSAVRAHSHDFLLKGGQSVTNDEPLYLTDPASTQNIGKTGATDRTVVGGSATTGGVQNKNLVLADEIASTSDLHTFKCKYMFIAI